MNNHARRRTVISLVFACLLPLTCIATAAEPSADFPLKSGDRVHWIGSSSTRIGTWCRTMEYVLRTRHPELNLVFSRSTTGGGTFLTGIKNLPVWLGDFKPTVILYNYGGNDATASVKGIPQFKLNMLKTVEISRDAGARVLFMTHQSADIRVATKIPFDNRKLYAETMLEFAKENGWVMYDTHHPLEALQLACEKEAPDFTLNKDRIHLTDSAYVAWGFYLYDCMQPPVVESALELSADGKVVRATNCKASNVSALSPGGLEFTRVDSVLPLLPPSPIPIGNALKGTPASAGSVIGTAAKDALRDTYKATSNLYFSDGTPFERIAPEIAFTQAFATTMSTQFSMYVKAPITAQPRLPSAQMAYALKFGQVLPSRSLVPLEKYSRYMLKISGLEAGRYEVSCEGKPVGLASELELAAGVNLNTLLLDSKNPAPWGELAKAIWIGKSLDEIGRTKWKFRVEKK
ncbi:MAG: hypothetical protein WCT04_11195 [Planctomycetota bacterium]